MANPSPSPGVASPLEAAYLAVLKALSVGKLEWSKQKLLKDLRKQLGLSEEQYLRALDCALKDPEVIALRNWKKSTGHQVFPGHDSGYGEPNAMTNTKLEMGTVTVDKRISNNSQCDGGSRPLVFCRNTNHNESSTINNRLLTQKLGSGMINQLVGRRVERLRPNPCQKWVHAVITDYDCQNDRHCITYDFNMASETWEWLGIRFEIESSRLRILPGLPINLNVVIPSVPLEEQELARTEEVGVGAEHYRRLPELCVPYEDSYFMQCLQTSTLPDLQLMLTAVVSRQKSLLRQLISSKDQKDQFDPLVSALIEKEILKRRQDHIVEELKIANIESNI